MNELHIPVKLWAELGKGNRVEVTTEATVQIGEGHCPLLAAQTYAKPMAQTLLNLELKSGYELLTPYVEERK